MFGNYRINQGVYKFSLQEVIRKDFVIKNGSTITFNGAPLDANLDIQASYTVNSASLNDLIPEESSSIIQQPNVKVNCIMNLSGILVRPTIKLGIELPNERDEVQTLVRNYISTEEQMNMQILYLLGIGKFYTEDARNNQNSNVMSSVLSSTLSGQLNNALSQVFETNNWNIGTNLSTGDKGWTDMEVEGILSGQLLNNRLLINGNFGYRDNPMANTNFVGDFEAEWLINRSFMFAATGLLKEAGEVLEKVDSTSLSDGLKLSYYYQRSYLYSHLGQYMGDQKQVNNKYYNEFENANKHMLALVRPKDPLYWWCVASCNELSPGDSLFSALENVVLSSHHNTRLDAMNAYGLSNMYKRLGDKEKTMIYLIYSAMADLRVCNRDIASLQELSSLLYDTGDIDRAYAYMNYCLKAALLYPNRVRIINISTELDKIYANYQQRDIRWRNSLQNYLYVVTFFSIILVLPLIGLYRQTKKLRKSRTELDSANHSLNQHVVELSQMHKQLVLANQELQNLNELLRSANQKLQESNDVKEEYIGYVFSICSNYISKLDEYRKNINRKLKTGQFEEARQLTDNSSLTQNELKDFYANFDAIFLRVYPDFVADLNSLLRPEEQILLKDASELNTEVRIYALVRLGINDSVKIADFLHCSPQTVYNHRLRMRNKAIIPKDKFAEAVRLLGRGGK